MLLEKYLNINNPRTEKAVVGLTKEQFLILSKVFDEEYHKIQNERLLNGEIRRLPKGGSLGVLDTSQKKLFYILYYMKTYNTFDTLGFIFGFSSGHAHDHITRIFPVLKNTLMTLNVLPVRTISTVEELIQLVEKHGEIIRDGVESSCVRP